MKPVVAMLTAAHPHDDVRIYHKEARALADAGWPIEIWNPAFEGTDGRGVFFRKVLLPVRRPGRMLFSARAMARALRHRPPAVCLLHDPELLSLAGWLQRRGIRTVFDAHEDYPGAMLTKPWIPAPLRKMASAGVRQTFFRLLPRLDGVIAATQSIAETLPGAVVVRNRVTSGDCLLFDDAAARQRPLPKTVCYAGSISAQRGIANMVLACHAAGATLLLAGAFESDRLRQSLEAMPEYACVRYRGTLDREGIAALYALSGAGLLLLPPTPAYLESEPVKLFEYLCAGLPVIAGDFPAWRALAGDAPVSFVPTGDREAITREIIRLTSDPDAREAAFGRREMMRARYDFSSDRERLLELVTRLGERAPSTF